MRSTILAPSDARYPESMDEVARMLKKRHAPPLFVRGTLPQSRGLAVVGSRDACGEALALTDQLTEAAVAAGFSIWSGGAAGVDRAAHQAALARGGHTVLVAPGGLDRPFPDEHAELYESVIAGGGALLSLKSDETRAARPHFIQRNCVLAGLTFATLMVVGRVVSGTRSTMHAARRFGRMRLVVPGAPWRVAERGNAVSLAEGAIPVIGAEDLYHRLRLAISEPLGREASGESDGLSGQERQLLEQMGSASSHPDALCSRLGRPFADVNRLLMRLLLKGHLEEPSPGIFRRRADRQLG